MSEYLSPTAESLNSNTNVKEEREETMTNCLMSCCYN